LTFSLALLETGKVVAGNLDYLQLFGRISSNLPSGMIFNFSPGYQPFSTMIKDKGYPRCIIPTFTAGHTSLPTVSLAQNFYHEHGSDAF
jgi:hypothetical protein